MIIRIIESYLQKRSFRDNFICEIWKIAQNLQIVEKHQIFTNGKACPDLKKPLRNDL